MRKDVIIHINGKPKYENSDEVEVELTTSGRLYRKNGDYYIIYKESELTGMEGATTTLKLEGDRVTLMRNGGNCASHMVFKKGERHFGVFDTEYGSLSVAISARDIKNNINDNGGELTIDYDIEIDSILTGENLFKVNIREREPFLS